MTARVALVTGGAQGIGKAITTDLLKGGYKVGILDLNETVGKQTADELSSQFGSGSCVFFKCDVTVKEQLQGCYDKVEEKLGKMSVVVNNAGFNEEAEYYKLLDINLRALMDSTFMAMEKMRKDKGGKGGTIVNMASMAGITAAPVISTYVASKWGVVGFTKSVADTVAVSADEWGISLMTLCPGAVDTGFLDKFDKMGLKGVAWAPDSWKKFFEEFAKERGVLSVEEIADAFHTLLKENKNGSVMKTDKDRGGPAKAVYMEYKWTEVE